MEFLYPNMLYALFALIIPIVIHLFNFRRHKTVYFSNTSILKTIEQENKKTKKLKDLIVLITRMLFIAALVIAFAYPYKKDNNVVNNNVDNLIAVYIDNSMSMHSPSLEKTLFEDSRSSALKLVENLNQTQKFILLSNDRNLENEYPMNKDEMIMRLHEMNVEGTALAFVVENTETKEIMGTTRIYGIDQTNYSCEIGSTYYGKQYQRTHVNTTCKYLLLKYCFEQMGTIRVQFKTDELNVSSQRAIERIGGVKEGILRNERIRSNGFVRNAVVYSIIDSEWSEVKYKRVQLMNKYS